MLPQRELLNLGKLSSGKFTGHQRFRNMIEASSPGCRLRDAAVRMNGSELDLVQSYQPPNSRSSSGTLAKKGRETPAACAADFTAASFGPCATSRLPSSATHSPV